MSAAGFLGRMTVRIVASLLMWWAVVDVAARFALGGKADLGDWAADEAFWGFAGATFSIGIVSEVNRWRWRNLPRSVRVWREIDGIVIGEPEDEDGPALIVALLPDRASARRWLERRGYKADLTVPFLWQREAS